MNRQALVNEITLTIKELIPAGPLRDYIMVEVEAVCVQSEKPCDDIASILFCSASSVLQVGRRILSLRNKETGHGS